MMEKKGKVFICGAGPGDPGLVTVRAMALLKMCNIILYDRLVGKEIIDQIPAKAEKVFVGRTVGDPTTHQDRANKLMVQHAKKGKTVLRLKGGDPFIFGRGAEEAEYLIKHGIEFEIVPGITSAIASPAYAGIPLTHRRHSSSVAIVTGHEDAEKDELVIRWGRLAGAVDTIVVLMGIEQLGQISNDLVKAGMKKSTRVAIVESGTTSKQRVVRGTLGTIAAAAKKSGVRPPAVIVRQGGCPWRHAWLVQMILKGKTLAITRSERDAEEFSRLVAAEGGKAIALPTIEIVPAGPQAAREFLDKLHDKKHDYCAFMSSQAVSVLFELASKSEIISALESTAVIAVGPKTRQSLEERGISVRLMPEKFSSACLVELLLSGAKPAGKKIIIPRSGAANEFATEALTKIGMQVDEVSLYSVRTCAPSSAWGEFSSLLLRKKVDAVIFTSASSVGSFFEIMAKISPGHPRLDSVTRVVSIGPFTSKELRGRGIIKCFEVKEHTVKGALELAKNIV